MRYRGPRVSPRSPSPLSPRPVSPQLLVLAGALAVWSVWGEASFVALLGAYALAWLLLQVVALRFPAALRLRLASAQRLGVLALLALVSAVALWRAAPELRESERLDALVKPFPLLPTPLNGTSFDALAEL